jgi:hypothetical protein
MDTVIAGIIGTFLGIAIREILLWFRTERERRDKFMLAALDKRLEAHQDAYKHWRRIVFSVDKSDKIERVCSDAQKWWVEHNLYLDSKSRSSFYGATLDAPLVATFEGEERKKLYKKLMAVKDDIIAGVCLSPDRREMENL